MSILSMEVCLAALLALTTIATGLSMVRNMQAARRRALAPKRKLHGRQ